MYIVIIYLIIMNIITFVTYGYDKYCAVINKWRVAELTLLIMAAIGGALGALIAMYGFHHKTQRRKFQIFVPLLLTIHFIILTIIF